MHCAASGLISDSITCGMHAVCYADGISSPNYYVQDLPFTKEELQLIPQSETLNKRGAWVPLGDYLSGLEKDLSDISGDQFFTVRLDGKNFNTLYQQLQLMGLFASGYSMEYETIMKTVCQQMTNHFANVIFAYTQSDEITLVFSSAPFNLNSETHEPHLYNGRHDKIISLTSSLATQFFCKQLMQLYLQKKSSELKDVNSITFDQLPIATFDARIAKYSTLSEAFQMVLWRSYDCSVNSVSTALRLFYSGYNKQSKNELNGLSTTKKALLLSKEHLLSHLTDHLKYGTLLYHGRSTLLSSLEAETGQKKSKRSKICTQVISGQTIVNVKEGNINLSTIS